LQPARCVLRMRHMKKRQESKRPVVVVVKSEQLAGVRGGAPIDGIGTSPSAPPGVGTTPS
jgi:hypothetical protein